MKFTTTLVGFCVLALVSLTNAQTKSRERRNAASRMLSRKLMFPIILATRSP